MPHCLATTNSSQNSSDLVNSGLHVLSELSVFSQYVAPLLGPTQLWVKSHDEQWGTFVQLQMTSCVHQSGDPGRYRMTISNIPTKIFLFQRFLKSVLNPVLESSPQPCPEWLIPSFEWFEIQDVYIDDVVGDSNLFIIHILGIIMRLHLWSVGSDLS